MYRPKHQRDYSGKQASKEFWSKDRPLSYTTSNSHTKRMSARMERARNKAKLYKEVQDA